MSVTAPERLTVNLVCVFNLRGGDTQGETRMSGESFDISYSDVKLINQPTGMSCWAASAAMVVGWRDQVSIDPTAIVAGTGIWSAYPTACSRRIFRPWPALGD
jgi:hypothetical protein